VYVDLDAAEELAATQQPPEIIYHDPGSEEDDKNLEAVVGKLPMFVNELPLIDQMIKDFGNVLAVSPIVHCELAGRGVEYANGRAKYDYRNKCTGQVALMEGLCRSAYGNYNIPQHLMAKFERRVRDYMRAYRMGVLTKDLEKMRGEIKTHRCMLGS
jgi:hypothetical protein